MTVPSIGDLLVPSDERLGTEAEPPILTLTEKHGFVAQSTKYKKRVAVADTSDYRVVRRNDIAFNPYLLWAGAIAQNTTHDVAIISPAYPTFRVREGCDPRYADHLLSTGSMRLLFGTISFGSVPRRRRASVEAFLTLPIPSLPDLPEQQRIAAILDKADAICRKRQESIRVADAFLRAAFLDVFGDPVTNPKGWQRAAIGELGSVQTGNTPPRADARNYGSHIEWIKTDNIIPAGIHPAPATERLSEQGLRAGRSVEPGAVLVTCIAGSVGSIGNAVVTDRTVAFNQQINAITPRHDVDPFFLYGLLLASKPLVQQAATTAMTRMVNKSKLEGIVLVKPPLAEQRRYSHVVMRLRSMRQRLEEGRGGFDILFESLSHRAFTDGPWLPCGTAQRG